MAGKVHSYTHLHSVEESVFQNELRYRWPDSNVQVETKVVGNSCSFWLIDEIAQ